MTAQPDSPAPRTERLLHRIAAVALAAVIVAALFAVAYFHAQAGIDRANAASREAQATVACVDRILSARAATTQADATAHIGFARALNALLSVAPNATKAEQAAAVAAFEAAAGKYVRVLVADQAYRNAHPLNLC